MTLDWALNPPHLTRVVSMETIRRHERKCSVLYRVLLEPEAVLPFLTVPRLCVCVCVSVCVFGYPTRHAGF